MSPSLKPPFLVRSYFHFSLMISVGLSSRRINAGGRSCDVSDCFLRLNVVLEEIFRWSFEKGLRLNSGKTLVIITCRDRGWLPALLPAVLVVGHTVPYSVSVKTLVLRCNNGESIFVVCPYGIFIRFKLKIIGNICQN
jgi:hypothetical protein